MAAGFEYVARRGSPPPPGHRRRPRALPLLLAWALLGLLAGTRARPSPASLPEEDLLPEPRIPTYLLIRVERAERSAEPPAWSGTLWAWMQEDRWVLLPSAVAVRGRWANPRTGLFLVFGAPAGPWGDAPGTAPAVAMRRVFRLSGSRPAPALSMEDRLAGFRRRFSSKVIAALGPDAGSLAAWIFLGPQRRSPRGWSEPFRRTGTLHLLAISGFHMTLLGGVVWLLLRIASRGARWARFPGLGILALYCCLIGAPVPATRAFGGALLLAFTPAWGRGSRIWDALGWTAAILPLLQPDLPAHASFSLSVSAAAGVFLGGELGNRAWKAVSGRLSAFRLPGALLLRGTFLLFSASAGAVLLTTPWSLHHFGVFYPRGVLVNLVAVPAMGLVMISQLVSLLAIACGAGAAHPLVAMGRGAGEGLLGLIRVASTWSGGWPVVGVLDLCGALAGTLAAGGLLRLAVRLGSRLTPGHPRPQARAVLLWCVLFMLPLAANRLARAARERPFTRGEISVRFLDVGQGDAILVRAGRQRWLVDLGIGSLFGRDRLVPGLLAAGAGHIDRVWITHGDADHWGGLADLLASAVGVDTLVLPCTASLPPPFWRALAESGQRPVLLRIAAPWERAVSAHTRVRCLHPFPGPSCAKSNDASLVLFFETEAGQPGVSFPFRLLLVGDLEREREAEVLARNRFGPVTIAQLGHHGSRTAGSEAWWARTRPLAAVISVGAGNHYGFPHGETLAALRARGIPVLRTDRDAEVRIAAGDGGIVIRRGRPGRSSPLIAPAGRAITAG